MKQLFLCAGLIAALGTDRTLADGPGDSVVRVYATIRAPNPVRPWAKQNPIETTGSGVVIDGKKILTNAHVVQYASEIYVQGRNGGDKVEAKLHIAGPGIDLAILTVDHAEFFAKRPPLPRGKDLPTERSAVEVYGFPIGGNNLSVTKGIISRIDFSLYNQQTLGLRLQVDAAINPGNSGGPALAANKMVGLVYAKLQQADNIGYIIPNEEIDIFLADIADGRYDGKPWIPGYFQNLQSDALRQKLRLDKAVQGILANRDEGPIKRYDILTKVGTHVVDNQGLVQLRDNLRLSYQYLVPRLMRDGKVPITLLRQGSPVTIQAPVTYGLNYLVRELRGSYPRYFMYGPLVFSPAMFDAISFYTSMNPFVVDFSSPLVRRRDDKVRFPGEELVVVTSSLLRHKIVRGYRDPVGQVVSQVNGQDVKNFRHLVELLRDCKDDYLTFSFAEERAEILVLPRRELDRATQELMEENGISRRGSPEAMAVWNKGK